MRTATSRIVTRSLSIATATAAGILLVGCSALFPHLEPRPDPVTSSGGSPSSETESSDPTTPPDADEQSKDVFTLAVGDCLNDTTDEEVSDVPQVDCAAPHDDEVYYDFEIQGDGAYPGEDSVTADAEDGCRTAFGDFVGIDYDSSSLDYTFFYPTEDSWTDAADRLVSCIVFDPDVKTTGSLAGAAR